MPLLHLCLPVFGAHQLQELLKSWQLMGLLGWRIRSFQGVKPSHDKTQGDVNKHPCPNCNLNPCSQSRSCSDHMATRGGIFFLYLHIFHIVTVQVWVALFLVLHSRLLGLFVVYCMKTTMLWPIMPLNVQSDCHLYWLYHNFQYVTRLSFVITQVHLSH